MTAATEPQSADRPFVITRSVSAPRELVWRAWTEPERMQHWWGPRGFTASVRKQDLRSGGLYHYCLRGPDGKEMWGKFIYREVAGPERLVFANYFSDADGGVTRHPVSPTLPLELPTTITFTGHEEKTAITVQWELLPSATQAERATFNAAHDGMKQGWSGTFDQLGNCLAKAAE